MSPVPVEYDILKPTTPYLQIAKRMGEAGDSQKKMIFADLQILLPAGSQDSETHIPSSSQLVSRRLSASRIQQAFDLEDSLDIPS